MLDNKYSKWYFRIVDNAKRSVRIKEKRTSPTFMYYEKHHIIPKGLGGENTNNNLVLLTAKEHFVCHHLLCKFTEGKEKCKMVNALIKMAFCKSNGQMRYTAKTYDKVRQLIAEKNSFMFKGIPKSKQMRERLSKTRTGMKFTEDHKHNISIAGKKMVGGKNSFFGKKHTEITKRGWSKKRKGIQPPFNGKGTKWYTNGKEDKMCFPNNIPDGFVLGRTKNRRTHELASKKSST